MRRLDVRVILKCRPDHEPPDDGDDCRHGYEVAEAVPHALPGTEAERREGSGGALPVRSLIQKARRIEPRVRSNWSSKLAKNLATDELVIKITLYSLSERNI